MTIAFRPLRNPNPLGFPGGVLPGFDPSHVAAVGVRFSGIATNKNFFSILSAKNGTLTNAPTAVLDGIIGPATNYGGGNNTDASSISGVSTVDDDTFTFGTICNLTSVSGGTQASNQAALFSTSSATAGTAILTSVAGHLAQICFFGIKGGAFNYCPGITLAANTPYFIAGSIKWSTGATNLVVVNLTTGVVSTTSPTLTTATIGAANGTACIGNYGPNKIISALAKIATVAWFNNFLSIPQLLAWAADPWAFWYPRGDAMLVGAAAAAAFKAYWAQNNLPVIGAGTY